MKYVVTFLLLLQHFTGLFAQVYPEFSPLSGRSMNYFSSAKAGDGFVYQLLFPSTGIVMYKIDANGALLDSMALPNRIGSIGNEGDRLVFAGEEWTGSVFTTMRQVFETYDPGLNLLQKVTGIPLQPIHGPFILEQTATLINTQAGDVSWYNDTLLYFQKYLVVDSPQVFLGTVNVFSKIGVDGTVYVNKPLDINAMRNCFFVGNHLIVQGSGYISPFEPRALLEFDPNGNLIRGIDYDAYGSGDFFDGALGGWQNHRYYFTYKAYDPNLQGCADDNAAIDVRDSSWTVIHRFKLPDCGYLVSGKMPFSFDEDNNTFYAAPHETFKKIMVYKFDPDFQQLWKRELDFSDQQEVFFPISQLPTDDGGILLNVYKDLNGAKTLIIFKISAFGDPISATELPLAEAHRHTPDVFPNPTSGRVRITSLLTEISTVQVIGMDGVPVGYLAINNGEIDLSALPNGLYTLSFADRNGRKLQGTRTVIKY